MVAAFIVAIARGSKVLLPFLGGSDLLLEFSLVIPLEEQVLQINWKHIRSLNGSQTEGFEEFCTQLARQEPALQGSAFVRKGKPDAGIECYWTMPSGDELAWQAKYFLSLDNTQWVQVDDSVKTALEKHPRLVRYYVCVPTDLPDARLRGQTGAHQKWLDRVAKWSGWATARGMSVEFIWWGSHEMLEKLAKPVNAGLVKFWFDVAVFDSGWFAKRLQEAISTAGPRYTPEVNVELTIAREFEAFGRTSVWVTRLKRYATDISKAARLVGYDSTKLDDHRKGVEDALQSVAVITSVIRDISVGPTGPVSFASLIGQMNSVRSAISSLTLGLSSSERAEDGKPKNTTDHPYRENPFRSTRFRLHDLDRILEDAGDVFAYTEQLAQSAFLILDGSAGMGKTHLLCDLAAKRLNEQLPTILLMGQRFLQSGDPWTQTLQQLDLARFSAEEFIGALESAAQVSNSRALVMIDALNEGAGRSIWPNHMSAFLELAARSPWISVVVSVRTSYEALTLPATVSETATRVHHSGFADHEYDASKTFFQHYGIELPSTPLLAPEYRSPLFLKTMCVGLRDEGHTRLPRGFHGISQVFRLYTNAVNRKLSTSLDFDPRTQLGHKAIQKVVSAFPSHQTQWLSRDEARSVIDSLLPNRTFHDSLYQGLVTEGLIVEDFIRFGKDEEQEFVHLGYERLADHFTAEVLLESCQQRQTSQTGEVKGVIEQADQLSFGVLESLFIQAPESLKQELMDFAPSVLKHWRWPDAYRQSLVWRAPSAFTDRTLHWFNKSIRQEPDEIDALEVVLTLATVPDHPWNAQFLNRQLQKRSMPKRDEWWTIKLHSLFADRQSAVHRIIDWALTVTITDVLDEDAVQLASLTLAWMFSSSNRHLRDRATKANLNLLNGREALAAQLVRSFADVDDLYIKERVLAVAYGVAMRSNNAGKVRQLADAVLETVFEQTPAVAHLLLRDYARGVIERSHSLAPFPEETMRRVRPPYGSKWPRIPSTQTIKRLEDSFKANGKEASGARRITFSVLHDDFGRYVIGTNSGSTDWLSLRLDEPAWRSYSDRIREFETALEPSLQPLWNAYTEAETRLAHASAMKMFAELRRSDDNSESNLESSFAEVNAEVDRARKALLTQLDSSHSKHLKEIWRTRKSPSGDRPPQFDLRLMQRYIVKRVFSLGWSAKLFEYFDTHVIRYTGRDSSKAERIGKKYQWIAYHEICALVADNFQFRSDGGRSESEAVYEGPWQDFFRNIDPSHALLKTGGEACSTLGWWAPHFEPDWKDEADGKLWAEDLSQFPNPIEALTSKDPNGQSWLALDMSLDRERPIPEGMDREEVESRKIWCRMTGFLVRTEDVDVFMKWAEGVDFWGQWMPRVPSSHQMFLGEYLWSSAWKHFDDAYYSNDGWVKPGHECPVLIRTASFEYHQESSGFDCSVDSGFTLNLPDEELARALDLKWSGEAADFRDATGQLIARDPSTFESGPTALLLRQDVLDKMAGAKGFSICWTVLGEKLAYLPGAMKRMGACCLSDGKLTGFVHFFKDSKQQKLSETILATKRF